MKILLTGGGTGGHFYPLIAITEAIYELSEEERLLAPEIILASDSKYNTERIKTEQIIFKKIPAGKIRRYFSLLNFIDIFKTLVGILKSVWLVYSEMPDVIFGKGGYASFPVLFAARILRIPTMLHESDSVPGRVNRWGSKFAKKIAISFPETAKYFPKDKTALTGTPVRKSIIGFTQEEGREIFNVEPNVPVILVLGGSQGSQKINDVITLIAPEIVKKWQIIHQCGKKNFKETQGRAQVALENSIFKNRYHLYPYLNDADLRNASSVSDLIISRAGGTAIYEIAAWKLPSIIIPIRKSAQNHQRENAYAYSQTGAADVIEEENLTPHVLLSEIERIISDEEKKKKMKQAAKEFSKTEAARKIAQEIINLGLEHAK